MTAVIVDIVERLLDRGAPVYAPEFTGPCPDWCRAPHDEGDDGDGPHERSWNAPGGFVTLTSGEPEGSLRVLVVDHNSEVGDRMRRFTLDEARGLAAVLTVVVAAAGYKGRHAAS